MSANRSIKTATDASNPEYTKLRLAIQERLGFPNDFPLSIDKEVKYLYKLRLVLK